jgi:hypothetical protein
VALPRSGTLALILSLCLALGAVGFFGVRAGRTARHMHWRNERIQPWMSVPFVAHIHHTHSEPLFAAIHVAPDPHDHRSIRQIAHAEHKPVAELIGDLEKAIQNANKAP